MKKILCIALALITLSFSQTVIAQNTQIKKVDPNRFDEKTAREQAKSKEIASTDIEGYVQFLKNDFSSKRALAKQPHVHSPYEPGGTQGIQETVIYLEPNKPMSLGCPNMGFEQYNFNGWTGGTGTVTTGPVGGNPTYNSTGGVIVNSAGNNVSLLNTVNYHTIMTIPPTNKFYPVCAGYDSLAVRAVGSATVSDIPFISPYSFDPVSVRLNSANPDYKAARLKYVTTTSSTNQRLSFSYAVILNDPVSHTAQQSPYFKVEVRNEATGAILTGCTSYTFNPKTTLPSDSLKTSVLTIYGDIIKYRKWQYYSVDLSTLPAGTNVSVNFEVGGCTQIGHTGYAYVDAECGGIGTPYANMCSGSNFATLVAPTGFNNYQWYDPSGALISGATNDTLIQTGAVPGTTYSVNMVSPGGCAISQTVIIGFTTVNIINLNATSSCAGGNSGTASVLASGSNGIYTYTWTSLADSSIVSTSQIATGLAPGSYSVLVSSTTCGQASANLSVGVSPPFFFAQTRPFCGNAASIGLTGGSNYTWYQGSTLLPTTNDTLYIAPAVTGDIYNVVYTNAQGCRDSIAYTLNLVTGGSSYFSNTTNVCPNDSNGTTVLNLSTPFSAPYSYLITGPTAANTITNTTNSSATTLSLTTLAPGTYTALISDGLCIYNNTVTVGVIQTNFTMTPTNTVLCFPEEVTLNLDFGNVIPSSCGLSASGSCANPTLVQVGNGTTVNSSFSSPAPYGNYDKNRREQYLFTASELLAAGLTPGYISSLSFQVNSILPLNTTITSNSSTYIGTLPNYSVKMKCTSATALSDFDNAGLIQVYFGNFTPVVGTNTHNLTQAYAWDGVSSLIVDVCYTRTVALSSTYYTSNPITPGTNTGSNRTVYFSSDATPACGNLNGTTSNIRPNLQFGNCGASSPSSYTVSVSSNGTITTNYGNDSLKVAPSSGTPPASGSIIYTVSVANPVGGCVATQTVEVLYPPVITSITAFPINTSLCEGSAANLSALGAFNYNWFYQNGIGGSLQPIATTSSITVTPPAVGTNTYIVIGNSPCPSSIADTATVTVNVIPMANLIITPLPDVTKCLNQPFTFNPVAGPLTPGNTGAPYSYSWTQLPGNTPAPGVNSTASYTTNSNTTTTLVVTVNGVCAIPTSDTVVVKNFVNDLGVTITNSVLTCPNKLLDLNATVTGGYPVYNYTWSVNSIPAANTPTVSYTSPSSGGTYVVSVSVMDSCQYQTTDNDVIVVLPNTLNIAIIDSVSLCGNTPFTLSSASSGGYPDYSYQWFLIPNANSISNTAGLSSTTPASEGNYAIQVVISDSCGYQKSDIQIINVLPPCQVEIPNVITPNGDLANDYFRIKNLEYHPNTSVTIFDRWGLKVFESTNYNNEWKGDGVSDGTFFYVIDVPQDKKYSGFITVFRK